ncbi:hypothetical protein [Magnetospirillum aberrantis]|uniref:Uncharacterized protein n=1 Tax=Magnetospirillum aberrantis SpK TaxID=908842 RepID=A0A7C9QUK7_9PROT|nr:hypothetical protein [Magnetospirillum aberrantis]NFV80541.1 hypothetical protein [Magnetospirillum aberrantis SpK]
MAKGDSLDTEDKVRILRSLAFHVHRKRPADEALMELVEQELRGTRRRVYRAAAERMAESDTLGALLAIGAVSDEVACVLGPVIDDGDHRLLSNALNRLADWTEQQG